ncbi:MAG: hypothetical protein Q8M93_24595 [Polaromonas sp.]|uniref:DUF6933 domain-containing protein n=1 Tax=Polaromonas sp. TaxID=1869339 RepID=UPI002731C45C|nr:hypothetical protein [Polaromonas sp.]MDP2452191.1 hypothetical protein [Polaromonas sp.]MDP3250129.1 hypothetical protein [Polaromonas sp.]MDP3755453.1 hypothetical protein [Polaromonas sp.]MDP3827881.1 hypothetical protein [Polaromonas sp.]
MVTLHVTRELARALKLPAQLAVDATASGCALGPWSLGLVHCRPAKLVVAVSASTRWAMALHAAPLATLQQRFSPALLQNLLALGVPPDRARAEVDAHAPVQWALGHNRGVLTHLNQCAGDVLWAANDGLSLPSVNHRLAERIIIKPQTGLPASDVLRLLGGDPDNLDRGKRAQGQAWRETYALMQAQAGQEVVTMPVLRLLGSERLEARHQAEILMSRLPVDERRSLASGRAPRWIPGELVLDLTGIEAVSPTFAAVLHAEASALGLRRLILRNALEDVAAQMLQIK